MSFTDQKRFIVDQEWIASAQKRNKETGFCAMCNHQFLPGDGARWVYANGPKAEVVYSYGNFFTCDACDGPDVLDRYQAACTIMHDHMKGHTDGHWPVSVAVQLLEAERACSEMAEKAAMYDDLCH